MRHKLLLLPICMGLCFLLIPDRAPVASSSQPILHSWVDDGQSLPDEATFAELARTDPVLFLVACLRRHNREIQSYSGLMVKQERIKNKLKETEVIDFWFREKPYSVLMKWQSGSKLLREASSTLYVENENNGKVLIVPNAFKKLGKYVERDPESDEVKGASRYGIREFSIRQGTERTWLAWKAAQEKGILFVEYEGIKPIAELDNRPCYVLKRTCKPTEEDGIATVEIMVDTQTWLQLGSVLRNSESELIGRYYFTQLKINPEFPEDQFTKDTVRK
ncbi:MAG TPA: DUF1571 domain-containing protein [Gemmataceae bacterium]|nr:DUF1571 domain-containing protein [Gemmataceae bacterium]